MSISCNWHSRAGKRRYAHLEYDAASSADGETAVQGAVGADELAAFGMRTAVRLQVFYASLGLRIDDAGAEPRKANCVSIPNAAQQSQT